MKSSENDNSQTQAMILIPLAALVVLGAALPFLKYLPLVLFSIPVALIYYGTFQLKGSEKFTAFGWNSAFLALIMVFLVGFPFENQRYYGFIGIDAVTDFFQSIFDFHNRILGGFSKYFPKVVNAAKITDPTYYKVSQYFWTMIPVGLVIAIGLFTICSIRDKFFKTGMENIGSSFLRFLLVEIQRPVLFALYRSWEPLEAMGAWAVVAGIAYAVRQELRRRYGDIDIVSPTYALIYLMTWVLIFYSLVMTILVGRAVSQRLRIVNLLVPAFDFMLTPLYRILSINIRKKELSFDHSKKVFIGQDMSSGEDVVLTERNLNYHTQVIGGSGAGKTNLLKNVITSRVLGKKGLIFLDLKADFDTVMWMKKVCTAADRVDEFKLFSMADPEISLFYNPVARGSATEIHSRLMNAMKWSEEFYRKTSSHALSDALIILCELRENAGIKFDLRELQLAVSDWAFLENIVKNHVLTSDTRYIAQKRIEILKTKDGQKMVQGISTDLLNIVRSKAGPLLVENSDQIDLFDSIQSGDVVYFLMDSMSDKESSELLGRLLLQDLIGAAGRIYTEVTEENRKPTQIIIDEFAAFASENFIDFINRARGAGLGVMVAHQSRGDLMSVHETFCDRIERNCATKLIFGTDNSDDAEYFASMVGTRKRVKDTYQMQETFLSTEATGMRSRREVEEFIIHPNEIKNFRQGELLRISRTVDSSVNLTKVSLAPEFDNLQVDFEKRARVTRSRDKEGEKTILAIPEEPIHQEVFL